MRNWTEGGTSMDLMQKIQGRSAVIGVIGLGYVGLPLILAFEKAGFKVNGFDVDAKKIDNLKAGKSYIKHISSERIALLLKGGRFIPTTDFSLLKDTDCIIICVPTPLDKYREPDLSFVFDTARSIAMFLRTGQLVSLESTTYPGTTDEDMRAILETGGLKAGKDFYLAFSPEREDPNNKDFTTNTIPKVVGGFTSDCLRHANALYGAIVEKTVPVSSTKVAESAKLLENIYRAVNIALVNELKILFDRMGIDIWEVIEAAKTKPFGFQAFYPGPGLGGHCIPIDPFYLTWKARAYDFNTKFIELAGEINTSMPYYVVEKIGQALNGQNKSINGAQIIVLGLAYKKDIDDDRESPSYKLIELLSNRGAIVSYNDPFVPKIRKVRKYSFNLESVPITKESLSRFDCVVVSTAHSSYDYSFIAENAKLIVDTRNAMGELKGQSHIVKA